MCWQLIKEIPVDSMIKTNKIYVTPQAIMYLLVPLSSLFSSMQKVSHSYLFSFHFQFSIIYPLCSYTTYLSHNIMKIEETCDKNKTKIMSAVESITSFVQNKYYLVPINLKKYDEKQSNFY